jgi:hypothetical protein
VAAIVITDASPLIALARVNGLAQPLFRLDHMGPVGITVPAGIQHQLFSLSFVLLAQVLPVTAGM